jgi:hypothetical protein
MKVIHITVVFAAYYFLLSEYDASVYLVAGQRTSAYFITGHCGGTGVGNQINNEIEENDQKKEYTDMRRTAPFIPPSLRGGMSVLPLEF